MELFTRLESQYGLPTGLLDAVWEAESSRGRNMLSPKGAAGHMGFMPATAKQYGVDDPHDLSQAATGAARMYADLLRQSGEDLPRALAGYNWGAGNLARKGFDAAPAETRGYIQKVTAAMGQPQTSNDSASDEWASLAQQFAQPQANPANANSDPWAELAQQFGQPKAAATATVASAPKRDVAASSGPASLPRLAQTAAIPIIGPSLAAMGVEVDAPAVAKGLASGFADIGNTLMNRMTKAGADAMPNSPLIDPRLIRPPAGVTNLVSGQPPMSQAEKENAARSASLEAFNRENAGPWFAGGRLAGNVIGTYPVGGAIAAPLRAAAPALGPLAEALATGGFRTGLAPTTLAGRAGNVALRAAGGAGTGAASAGLVDPNDAGVGAIFGATLPPTVNALGRASSLVGAAARRLVAPQSASDAAAVLQAGGYSAADLPMVRAALTQQGPRIVPEQPTVSQVLMNPEISQLERSVRNAPGGGPALLARDHAQNEARLGVLDSIAPVAGDLPAARTNFGNTIAPRAQAARSEATKQVNRAFNAVDPTDDTRFFLPIKEMEAAQAKFLGDGTFGTGGKAQAAVDTARRVGTDLLPNIDTAVPKAVTFRTVQNLRSSVGEAAEQARAKGANKEAAALDSMKADIDARVDAVARGEGKPGEFFPPDIVAQWRKAIDLHAEKQSRFARGPQASMFRKGGDGNYSVEGGELAPKFFSPRGSQSEDIEALRRMGLGDDVLDSLKSYATTDASRKTTAGGTLSAAQYNRWRDSHAGAIRGLFNEGEQARLAGVGQDVQRAADALGLGRATGSNTSQNVQNALGLGLLDSPAVNMLASRTPLIGRFTGPILDALKESAKRGKAERIGALLSSPQALDDAIAAYERGRASGTPFLLGDSSLTPALLRAAPLLASDR